MTGIIAQLGTLHVSTAARVAALMVLLGLLASAVAAPHAIAGMHGTAAVAADPDDCPWMGGDGADHHALADAHAAQHSNHGDIAGAGDHCGPAACCPGDLAIGFEGPPRPQSRAQRAFGRHGSPRPAPGDLHDRPPRLS